MDQLDGFLGPFRTFEYTPIWDPDAAYAFPRIADGVVDVHKESTAALQGVLDHLPPVGWRSRARKTRDYAWLIWLQYTIYMIQQSQGKDSKIAWKGGWLGHVNNPCSRKFHSALNNIFPEGHQHQSSPTRTHPQDLVPFARTAHSSQHAWGWWAEWKQQPSDASEAELQLASSCSLRFVCTSAVANEWWFGTIWHQGCLEIRQSRAPGWLA